MKTYYFENIYQWSENGLKMGNLYFTKDLIVPYHYANRMTTRKIEVNDKFWISPSKVYVDLEYPLQNMRLRDHFVRMYLFRGCALLLSCIDIDRNADWKKAFSTYVMELRGIAIDYMVIPRINIKHLTPEMVRFFGVHKVPFILSYLKNKEDLNDVKWGWIRQMQMLLKTPIACLKVPLHDLLYATFMEQEIVTLSEQIGRLPLTNNSLKLTGISPKKGVLSVYSDTDFNLFRWKKQMNFKHDLNFIHNQTPYISVMKGNMIKSKYNIHDDIIIGEYCHISITNHF